MATIQPAITKGGAKDESVKNVLWETLDNTNLDGGPVPFPEWSDRTVQVIGTFDTATVTIQGSLDGGTTWATLTDDQGADLAFTAAGLEKVAQTTGLIRPLVSSAGGSTDVDVYLLCHRPTPMRN
jgi:hypothetical protein